MQRQRDGLVPIGDALSDLPVPVQAPHDATAKASPIGTNSPR